jgi:SAM-dependent methyltransferase
MLDRARTLLGPDVPLVLATLPELGVEGTFDAAVCTFDGLNYLAPDELHATFAALADRLRPGGWFVFDVHTDAMMDFTVAQPVVTGEAEGSRFTISSDVDPAARTCVTTIELDPSDGLPFEEEHRQWFHSEADLRAALAGVGFAVAAVQDEYTAAPADESSLRATWIARRS